MVTKDLGMVTAYAYAVAGGYTGTEAEFTQLMADLAVVVDDFDNFSVNVTTLPAGSSATASYADGVLSLGIPKGDTGATGETGATPNFTIGAVETLEPGESATASITGTAEAPVLNLGIPEGQAGSGAVGTVASAYSASKTYAVGDYAIHNSNLYRCTTAITTAEAFTAAHWTQVVLGDDVSDLKSDLSCEINDRIWANLFNADEAEKGYYLTNNGKIADNRYAISHPIYVKSGVTYKTSRAPGLGNLCFYGIANADGTITTGSSLTGTVDGNYETYTFDENCWIIINLGYGTYDKKVFIEQSKYSGEFVEYFDAHNSIRAVSAEKADISAQFNKTANLFDKGNSLVVNDKYITSRDIATGSGYSITHPIPLEYGKTYKMPFQSGYGSSIYMGMCKSDGTLLSTVLLTNVNLQYLTFTATENGYGIFNYRTANVNSFMICEDTEYPESYVPYGYEFDRTVILSSVDNPLYGKKITLNGDSICYGAGYLGGYGKIIAEKNSMAYQNVAVAGGTIAAEQYDSSFNPRHWICRTITSMDADADYAILEGGVNGTEEIGTITSGYTSELDDTTFAGAFESMLKQAILRFKGKKVGFIFVHKMASWFSSNGDDNNRYYIAKKCCEKWGVPYCDLNTKCPPLGYIQDLADAYTLNGDGWHPNEAGYKAYYVNEIEAWLKTL